MTETKSEKKSTPKVQLTMYTQQLEYLEDNNPAIYDADPANIVKNVYDALSKVTSKNNNTGEEVQTYPIQWIAWNVHDSDVLKVWSDAKKEEILEPKATHIHMIIKFGKRVEFTDKMSDAVGESLNNFEKPGRGRYAEENMLAYLVHAKSPSKHFYDKEKVGVLRTETVDSKTGKTKSIGLPTQPNPEEGTGEAGSYVRYFNEHKDAWMKQRATVKVKEHKVGRDELIELIFNYKVSKDEVMTNPDYRSTYIGNSAAIDKAFEIRMYNKFKKLNEDFDAGKFSITVAYIWGESGNGKTTLARSISKYIHDDMSVYVASPTNPFDSYRGEDAVIMDDVKANTLSPNEWLALMDPTMFRELGSRYKNKPRGFKTMIITGVQRPEIFFNNLITANTHGDVDVFGPLVQFLRRLVMVAKAESFNYDVSKIGVDSSLDNVLKVPVLKKANLKKTTEYMIDEIQSRNNPDVYHRHFELIEEQLEKYGLLEGNTLYATPLYDANPELTSDKLNKFANAHDWVVSSVNEWKPTDE